MTMRRTKTNFAGGWRVTAWVVLVAFMFNPILLAAQTPESSAGVLKPGDQVRLVVPGRPALDQELVLDATGSVTIDPVGSIHLAGLTVDEATVMLKQKLRLFYPTIDTISLEAGKTASVRIYVMGAVSAKGVMRYEAPPTLWDVLRSMGGPGDNANLGNARIIRESEGAPQLIPVDLSGMMTGEGIPEMELQDGDTIVIPALVEGVPAVEASEGVKVFGSVTLPTIVPIKEATPLMDVLMLAGAPTETAEKTRIYWVHNDGERERATVVDLNRYLLYGDLVGNPLVYPGDTVNVDFKRPSWARNTFPFVLGSLAAVATIALAWDSIVNE